MNSGLWHQMTDRSQKIVLEQLEHGNGDGIILSSRDLKYDWAKNYAPKYLEYDIDLIFDHQFYIPKFLNSRNETYPTNKFRKGIPEFKNLLEKKLDDFSESIEEINETLDTTALLAPSIIYEVGRKDIDKINHLLYQATKRVGNKLGIPTYKSVIIGNSLSGSQSEINNLLSRISEPKPDGWYASFEFQDNRIPFNVEDIERFLSTILHLKNTEKPVLNAFSGPLSLLGLAAGARGVGVGHFQNTWHYQRSRWQETPDQGGGGNAPARFFSKYLWGTIIYPDETSRLNDELKEIILEKSQSPFSENTLIPTNWSRWKSHKHIIFMIGDVIAQIQQIGSLSKKIDRIIELLNNAIELHEQIGFDLKDETDKYQENWLEALSKFQKNKQDDIMLSDLLS